MVNETGPKCPREGGNNKILSLKNEMAKYIRKAIADDRQEMERIDSKKLQEELYSDVYEKGNFNITDDEAEMLTTKKAERFVELRESMTAEERENYVGSATAVHREETNKKFNRNWEEKILKRDGLDINKIRSGNKGDAGYEGPLNDPEDER